MVEKKIETHSDAETKKIGFDLASTLTGGDIICLYGELGAGKTTLVKGLAEALGITHDITSPTFTLMNVYDIEKLGNSEIGKLIHIDTYRLKEAQELIDIGAEDYIGQAKTITLIEWPEKIEELLINKKRIEIRIEHGKQDIRNIEIAKK